MWLTNQLCLKRPITKPDAVKDGRKTNSPDRKAATPMRMSSALNDKEQRQASRGNKDSGIWSRPVARLLGTKSRRRFTKLEKRSPAIAMLPARAPVVASRPSNGAAAVVRATETNAPRTVFEGPSNRRRSRNLKPPSIGCESRSPQTFFTRTGEPLAMLNNTSSFSISTICIDSGVST